jgi:hypothetical protein
MMEYLSSALIAVGPIAIAIMLLLLRTMGKRLGQALELPRYYHLYAVAVFFFLLPIPLFCLLLALKAWGLPDSDANTVLTVKIAVFSLPMAIAITLAVYATAKYWSWIWDELRSPGGKGGGQDAP